MEYRRQRSLTYNDSSTSDSSTSSGSDITNEKSRQRKATRKRLRPKFQYQKVTRLVNWRRSGRRRMPTSAWKPDRTPPRRRPSTSDYGDSSRENQDDSSTSESYNDSSTSDSSTSSGSDITMKIPQRRDKKETSPQVPVPKVTRLVNWRRSGDEECNLSLEIRQDSTEKRLRPQVQVPESRLVLVNLRQSEASGDEECHPAERRERRIYK
ncbi:hypothetical protein JTE90_015090 [Oedothorax gibbosus]|uniref:Uncharacterized protein n=1 Tax=Oedothorax gibbosus TaxID=931172 RepID=A0AAV6VS29_9ARAC|nr:hypothetical protein JTE90_015090 [Oedothorax gibbosus]